MEKLQDIEETKRSQYSDKEWGSKKRKHKLHKNAKFDTTLIEPIKNMISFGFTEKDIGLLIGVSGLTIKKWKQRYPDLKEACQEAKSVAASHLVAQMVRTAMGYRYEEVVNTYVPRRELLEAEELEGLDELDPDEMVLKSRKVTEKHQPGNAQLAMFVATNILPRQFSNRFEIDKKESKIVIKAELTGEEIRGFAGKLLEISEEVGRKVIASEVRDTERPPDIIESDTEGTES